MPGLRPLFDSSRPNYVGDATRLEMLSIEMAITSGEVDWPFFVYNQLVELAGHSLVAASTAMAHLSEAEVRALLATIVGYDSIYPQAQPTPSAPGGA